MDINSWSLLKNLQLPDIHCNFYVHISVHVCRACTMQCTQHSQAVLGRTYRLCHRRSSCRYCVLYCAVYFIKQHKKRMCQYLGNVSKWPATYIRQIWREGRFSLIENIFSFGISLKWTRLRLI